MTDEFTNYIIKSMTKSSEAKIWCFIARRLETTVTQLCHIFNWFIFIYTYFIFNNVLQE